ncbi:MAG: orotidine-5'-phosphate decarboxylase [Syntrophales bacterium]|jgi:orotidine-5'-phosphate decarboxylase|nr:orotidine-5'-phosphate decarboxylase [Syntrophales bacterium]MCK9527058.1 orotidine-5'-phosphate decarboxylase [Syntrophales bacterium]MDX9921817.1 orotidine-5'-phosphate decarboxylase [Syntrophales bacterium]
MKSNDPAGERLIFALDVGDGLDSALEWVSLLKDHVGLFKVGMEAFTRFGPVIVEEITSRGGKVFLDLKFHDIPNTTARAVEAAMKMPLAMINIHALGGSDMMRQTVDAAQKLSRNEGIPLPLILAVTILTSLNDADVETLGFASGTDSLVKRLALMARDCGVPGVVASARDVTSLRRLCGDDFIIVTPGIRMAGDVPGDDQKRTLTPMEAITAGADYIVVGRPIRTSRDPVEAAASIVEEISKGLAKKPGHT